MFFRVPTEDFKSDREYPSDKYGRQETYKSVEESEGNSTGNYYILAGLKIVLFHGFTSSFSRRKNENIFLAEDEKDNSKKMVKSQDYRILRKSKEVEKVSLLDELRIERWTPPPGNAVTRNSFRDYPKAPSQPPLKEEYSCPPTEPLNHGQLRKEGGHYPRRHFLVLLTEPCCLLLWPLPFPLRPRG